MTDKQLQDFYNYLESLGFKFFWLARSNDPEENKKAKFSWDTGKNAIKASQVLEKLKIHNVGIIPPLGRAIIDLDTEDMFRRVLSEKWKEWTESTLVGTTPNAWHVYCKTDKLKITKGGTKYGQHLDIKTTYFNHKKGKMVTSYVLGPGSIGFVKDENRNYTKEKKHYVLLTSKKIKACPKELEEDLELVNDKEEVKEFGPGHNNETIPYKVAEAREDYKTIPTHIHQLLSGNKNNQHGVKDHLIDYLNLLKDDVLKMEGKTTSYLLTKYFLKLFDKFEDDDELQKAIEKYFYYLIKKKTLIPQNTMLGLSEREKKLYEKELKQYNQKLFEQEVLKLIAKAKAKIEEETTAKELKKLKPEKYEWLNTLLLKNAFQVLVGEKAVGKTALMLNLLLNYIKKEKKCCLWVTGETSRRRRIDQFLLDNGFNEFPDNLIITEDRFETLNNIPDLNFLFIDDIHSYLVLENSPTEYEKKLNWCNYLSDLYKVTILGLGHQTKTSQKEKNFEMRGGGNARLVTVPRSYLNIEKTKKDSKYQGMPIVSIKTNIPTTKKGVLTHILKEDYSISESIEGDAQELYEKYAGKVFEDKKSKDVSLEIVKKLKALFEEYEGEIYTSDMYELMENEHKIGHKQVQRAANYLECKWKRDIQGRYLTYIPGFVKNKDFE